MWTCSSISSVSVLQKEAEGRIFVQGDYYCRDEQHSRSTLMTYSDVWAFWLKILAFTSSGCLVLDFCLWVEQKQDSVMITVVTSVKESQASPETFPISMISVIYYLLGISKRLSLPFTGWKINSCCKERLFFLIHLHCI